MGFYSFSCAVPSFKKEKKHQEKAFHEQDVIIKEQFKTKA